MALVAYDYGSESEEDEDLETETQQHIGKSTENVSLHGNSNGVKGKEDQSNGNSNKTSEISDDEDAIPILNGNVSNMFETLPQKKDVVLNYTKPDFDDVVEDFIPKAEVPTKPKAKVRIMIPSLSQFDEEEDKEPAVKKIKASTKGTGLLSILPPVKCVPISTKSFVPNVLTQKNKTNEQVKKPSKPLIPNSVRMKKEEAASKKKETDPKPKENESDESDIDMPETYDDELWQKVCGKKVVKKIIVEEEPTVKEPVIDLAPEPVAPYQGLDNSAFKELVGKSSRMPRNIKLIDINEEELVAEKDLWMTKSLTDPEYIPKPSEDDESIDPTKRKKHHITYLAQKAKATEQELQNQWATSKHNRMQSRAKYGF